MAMEKTQKVFFIIHRLLMQAFGRNQNLACCLMLEDRFA
jgi:hypothetical protein